MAKLMAKCPFCGESFDRNAEPFVVIPHGQRQRYAHPECAGKAEQEAIKEKNDKDLLLEYIQSLFDSPRISPRVFKQLKVYIEEYKYDYDGILASLRYFYEVKNGDKEKANGGIGIVPHVYDEARRYYAGQKILKETNSDIIVQDFVPVERTVVIIEPRKTKKRKNYFSFLDREEKEENAL